MRKHVKLFNTIAPVYGWFFKRQKRAFHRAYQHLESPLDLNRYNTALDLGCGTGALASMFAERGFQVDAVDAAAKMLNVAKRKTVGQSIRFHQRDILNGLPFEDNAFDIVIASYVAHGLSVEKRQAMYYEMARLAKHIVIIHDYKKNSNPFIALIECLERGHYFNFVKGVPGELTGLCDKADACGVRVHPLNNHAAWYVCRQTSQPK